MAGQVPLTPGSEKEFPLHTFVPGAKSQKEMLLEVGEKEQITLEPTLMKDKRDEAEEAEGETKPEAGTSEDGNSETKPAQEAKTEQPAVAEPEKTDGQGDEPNAITADPLQNLPSSGTAKTQMATHLITDSGLEFWLDDRGRIIKIEIPDQGLELILEKVESSLE